MINIHVNVGPQAKPQHDPDRRFDFLSISSGLRCKQTLTELDGCLKRAKNETARINLVL
jgi:hypothetical protein